MEMLITLIVAVVSQVYTYVKTYKLKYFKFVQFLYVNSAIQNVLRL